MTDPNPPQGRDESQKSPGGFMTLTDHLSELRYRILVSFFFWVLASVAGWFATPRVLSYIGSVPSLKDVQLILIRPPEAFFVRMKTAMTLGFLIALPVLIYHVTAFVVPGLRSDEKKWLLRLLPGSVLLFYTGAAFSVMVMLPIVLHFFLVQMTRGIATPQISLEEYVNFLSAMILLGGLIFQTPMVLFFLTTIGILSSDILASGRRYAIIIIFIIAALASPPDPFSQVVVAVPMLILYEATIWLSRLAKK